MTRGPRPRSLPACAPSSPCDYSGGRESPLPPPATIAKTFPRRVDPELRRRSRLAGDDGGDAAAVDR
jgi:hypothetical protein